jgi:CBS domain-containing protein
MQRKIMPDVVRDQELSFAAPATTVTEAARLMARRQIGALMVMEGDRLAGIVTERDIAGRVVAVGADPATTSVGEIMTRDPDTLAPSDTADHALKMMSARGYRHLPVVADGRVLGMVSVRDLFDAVLHELEDEIGERDAFIHGTGAGLA